MKISKKKKELIERAVAYTAYMGVFLLVIIPLSKWIQNPELTYMEYFIKYLYWHIAAWTAGILCIYFRIEL